MKKIIGLVLSITLFASCQQKSSNDQPVDADQPTKNSEYISLFDGTTMTGWRIFKNKPNDSWEVVDGTLHCKPFKDNSENLRSDIITEGQYENFELILEWKISAQGNSGVIYRVSEEYDETYATGPEYQVLDDEGYPGDLKPEQLSAGNYDMHAPAINALKPVGDWNETKIIVNGNHVEHWLNGSKIVEYELYSEDWTKRRDASKWKDFPGYATVKMGYIALQDHSNEVWYRNIRIKVLN